MAPQCNLVAPMSYSQQLGRFGLGNLNVRPSAAFAEFTVKRPLAVHSVVSIIPVGLMKPGAEPHRSAGMLPEIDFFGRFLGG
jgi:hypothetical protein